MRVCDETIMRIIIICTSLSFVFNFRFRISTSGRNETYCYQDCVTVADASGLSELNTAEFATDASPISTIIVRLYTIASA